MKKRRLMSIAIWMVLAITGLKAQNGLKAEMDFEYIGGHIVVQASIKGGEPLSFVFDTGAGGVVVLDEELEQAKALKIDREMPVMGASGETRTMKMSMNNPISMGDLKFTPSPVLLSNLQAFRDRGYDFNGVLGSRQIEDYVLEIDYVKRKLRFYDKADFQYEGEGIVLPIQRNMGIPNIEVSLNVYGREVKGRAMVDTGAAMALGLTTPTVRQYDLLAENGRERLKHQALGASGSFDTYQTRMESISFGGFSFENIPVQLNTVEGGPLGDPNFVGIIGNHIMRKFKVILDYERSQMILEPNQDFDQSFPVNATGIRHNYKLTKNEGYEINEVYANSPASKLGIKKGDELLMISGKKVGIYSLNELYDLFHSEGGSFEITWFSGGEKKTGILKPKNLI